MMERYKQAKREAGDSILLFRMGDFYEAFGEDAATISKVLGLTLTENRDHCSMVGIPYHALDRYVEKLVRAGHRVSVVDYSATQ